MNKTKPANSNVSSITQTLSAILIATTLFISGTAQAAEAIIFYHNDILGSPIATTDINGNLCWREDYYPYGEKRLAEDDANNDCGLSNRGNERGYTNHVLDDDIQLTYAQARYYDQKIGRFYAMDPAGVDLNQPAMFNRYAYGNNNPYKFTDPDGEIAIILAPEVVTGIVLSLAAFAHGINEMPDFSVEYSPDKEESEFTMYHYSPDRKLKGGALFEDSFITSIGTLSSDEAAEGLALDRENVPEGKQLFVHVIRLKKDEFRIADESDEFGRVRPDNGREGGLPEFQTNVEKSPSSTYAAEPSE